MKIGGKVIATTLVVTVLAVAGTFMLPLPDTWSSSYAAFHALMVLNVAMACIYIGAAMLFLLSLGVYKAKLQQAFMAIVASIVLIALGTLQLPVVDNFDKLQSAWVTGGGVVLPFLLAGLAGYVGIASFARLVGIRNMLTKVVVVLPAVLVLGGLTSLLPHAAVSTKEIIYDAANVTLAITGLSDLAALLLIVRVRRRIGAHYTAALSWMAAGLLAGTLTSSLLVIHTLVTASTQDAGEGLINLLAVCASLLWLRAGYIFTKTEDY